MKYAYLAFKGFENELESELRYRNQNQAIVSEVIRKDRLFFFERKVQAVWSQVEIGNLEKMEFSSISDAAKKLKSRGTRWVSFPFQLHRRTQLIQDQLPAIKKTVHPFPTRLEPQQTGFFTLTSENEMLFCDRISNPSTAFPIRFQEDKFNPPSRAYLKLWEVLSFHVSPPRPGEHVLDMGSCPGGWTWVLKNLKCRVTSVDKAPLDHRLMDSQLVRFLKKDAFKLNPAEIESPKWFFSDIICEPADLLNLVQRWLRIYPDLNFVCSIKYKGQTDFKTTDQFLKIQGSRIVHLYHNKHEVTWIKCA